MTDESIFTSVLALKTAAEREAYLDQACAGNPELRAEVEALLQADAGAGSFLNHPPVGTDATIAMSADHDTVDADSGPVSLAFLQPCDSAGRIGKIDHYEVIEVVGQGGMGVVLRAFDTKLSRIVAVKVMAPELAANPTAVKRFLREASTAAAVHHDHVVTIHAVGDHHRPPYIVMQFIEGQTLQQKIDREGALELKQILRIGSQMAGGLAAAHKHGLIHRDVKPANILLENGVERVKITDFGLARASDDLEMTQTGMIAGTPQYMSPEQAKGESIDARADLFSLGSVLYTMCTGRPGFRAETTMGVLKRVCDETPRPIREVNAEVPAWLEAIVGKLLAKNPADRFQSAAEVAELLSQHLAHEQNPVQVARPATVMLPKPPLPIVMAPQPPSALPIVLVAALLAIVGLPLLVLAVAVGGYFVFGKSTLVTQQVRQAQGVVTLRLSDPKMEYVIDGYGPNQTAVTSVQMPLDAGPHHVWFKLGDLELDTGTFYVQEGGRHELELEISADKAQALWNGRPLLLKLMAGNPPPGTALAGGSVTLPGKWQLSYIDLYRLTAASPSWTPLFNGQDLTGWQPHPAESTAWTVQDKVLVGRGPNQYLHSERGDYQDFHLKAEVKINTAGDGGLLVRMASPVEADTGKSGYEVQITGDANHASPTASIIQHGTTAAGSNSSSNSGAVSSRSLIQPDVWFVLEVLAVGGRLQVAIDDQLVADYRDDAAPRISGHIALQSFSEATEISFRKIEIRELPVLPPLAVAPFDAAQAADHQQAWAAHLGVPVEIENSLGMKLRLIPPGEFQMGSTQAETDQLARSLEQGGASDYDKFVARMSSPQHLVRLTKPYRLSACEVTVGQYRQFIEATKHVSSMEQLGVKRFKWTDSAVEPNADERAVIGVSWDDAKAFCKWLSEQEGRTYDLPSEAQWEYACRAGTTTAWSFGDDAAELEKHAIFSRPSFWPAEVVGSKAANPFGLFDIHGNADEWCLDWHYREFYASSPTEDPVCTVEPQDKNSGRVSRGGGALSAPWWSRVTTRAFDFPAAPMNPKGFRVAMIGDLRSSADTTGSTIVAAPPEGSSADILISADWEWTEPENLGPVINSPQNDGEPTLSADGLTLLFYSNRESGQGLEDLWLSTRPSLEDAWTAPVNLGTQVNSAQTDGGPALSADGLTLVFHSDRPGGEGDADLWMSTRADASQPWTKAVNLGADLNSSAEELAPALSADGLTLVFNSDRPGRIGQGDLWFSTRPSRAASWSPARNFGPRINSPAYQGFAALASDGLAMIFNSNGAGGPWSGPFRICTRTSLQAEWSQPQHLWKDRLGSWSACLAADHKTLLFDSKRNGSQGGFDIWTSRRVPKTPVADTSEVNALRELVAAKERAWEAAKAQFAEGRITGLGAKPAEVELLEARISLATAESNSAAVVAHLRQLVTVLTEERALTQQRIDAQVEPASALNDVDARLADAKARLARAEAEAGLPANNAPLPAVSPFDAAQAKVHQEAWAKHLGLPVQYESSLGTKFRLIPPGEFLMGSSAEEIEWLLAEAPEMRGEKPGSWVEEKVRSEGPARRVIIEQPYYLGVAEVRVADFKQFADATKYQTLAEKKGGGLTWSHEEQKFIRRPENVWNNPEFARDETKPVVLVALQDMQEFCKWLSDKEGRTCRLPREAEWEFACRAGTTTRWFFGEQAEDIDRFGWTMPHSKGRLQPSSRLAANPFGIFDLCGNVSEMAESSTGSWIERGGGYGRGAYFSRSADRSSVDPAEAYYSRGFRVVMQVAPDLR